MSKLLLPLVLLFTSLTCFGVTVTPEIFKEIRQAAEQGNAMDQLLLGHLYRFGKGVAKDDAEAVKWIRKAAEQGLAEAQDQLGHMYSLGKCVEKDHTKSIKWYRKAAEQGHAEAQFSLGGKYMDGEGVPMDFVLSYSWYNLAAAKGFVSARLNRDCISEEMTKEQIAEAQKMSREWLANNQQLSALADYSSSLRLRIDAAWEKPAQLAGVRLAAEVVFDVSPSGQITNAQLLPGSGNKAFDQSILAAFRSASSAGPTPTGQPHQFSLPFQIGQ